MRPSKLWTGVAAAIAALVVAVVGGATPGVGTTSEILARVPVNQPIKINTSHTSDYVVQKLTIDPGGTTGWHYHPGPTVVAVVEGTLVLTHSDCVSKTYAAGVGFFQPANEVHVARNPSTHNRTVVYASYVIPPGATLRIDAPNPGCP
jgi:quercetin dioxygenase-like cupin family protein